LVNAPGIAAIPPFIFAGYIFAESKASIRLVNLSNALLGWMPGGPTIVTVVACSIFTAMTGASGITIVAVGALMLPALLKEGYDESFSMGLVTSTGTVGLLFAPSLPIILYGLFARADITQLFIGGIIPGLLMGLALSVYGMIHAVRKEIPITPFSIKNLWKSIWDAKWEIPLPIVVVVGIYGGIITVSEAAFTTIVYVIITEFGIYREIKLKKLIALCWESMVMVGAILAILGVALGFTNYLVDQHVPQELMEFFRAHVTSKFMFLIGLNILLLIVGCVLEIFSAIIVVAPLVIPTALAYGVDPIHLGIIFLTNMGVSYLCPPVGLNLLLASLRFNYPIVRLYRYIGPFLLIMLAVLLIITYWPALTLWLIDALGQRPPLLEM
jgi:tripartite ATP-independent transporter DctM subunit